MLKSFYYFNTTEHFIHLWRLKLTSDGHLVSVDYNTTPAYVIESPFAINVVSEILSPLFSEMVVGIKMVPVVSSRRSMDISKQRTLAIIHYIS